MLLTIISPESKVSFWFASTQTTEPSSLRVPNEITPGVTGELPPTTSTPDQAMPKESVPVTPPDRVLICPPVKLMFSLADQMVDLTGMMEPEMNPDPLSIGSMLASLKPPSKTYSLRPSTGASGCGVNTPRFCETTEPAAFSATVLKK